MVNMANRANVHMGLVSCICFLGLNLCCKVPQSKWHCTLREKKDEEECLMESRARRRIWAGDQSKKATQFLPPKALLKPANITTP
jgi:hypothetical protein